MEVSSAQLHTHLARCIRPIKPTGNPTFPVASSRRRCLRITASSSSRQNELKRSTEAVLSVAGPTPRSQNLGKRKSWDGFSRAFVMSGVSVALVALLMSIEAEKAMALGPEGPLVEEFWENVRRYALYALTVSTGAIYTVLEPILDLLKNPISAILILVIMGGSVYIVSQVLSAMVGVSDFTYDYGY